MHKKSWPFLKFAQNKFSHEQPETINKPFLMVKALNPKTERVRMKDAQKCCNKTMNSSSFPLGFVATLTRIEWNGVIVCFVLLAFI